MKERIKPCPFCGSKRVEMNKWPDGKRFVECASCGASTCSRLDRSEAIALWNLRPLTTGHANIVWDMDKERKPTPTPGAKG